MKVDARLCFISVKFALWILWPLTAAAAQITFGDRMAQIPMLAIVMTLLLSTLSGITALLHAMKLEYEKSGEIARLWLFVSSKMFGANLAGVLMFLVAENYNLTDTLEAAAIILAAFGGGPLVERALVVAADKFLPGGKT